MGNTKWLHSSRRAVLSVQESIYSVLPNALLHRPPQNLLHGASGEVCKAPALCTHRHTTQQQLQAGVIPLQGNLRIIEGQTPLLPLSLLESGNSISGHGLHAAFVYMFV